MTEDPRLTAWPDLFGDREFIALQSTGADEALTTSADILSWMSFALTVMRETGNSDYSPGDVRGIAAILDAAAEGNRRVAATLKAQRPHMYAAWRDARGVGVDSQPSSPATHSDPVRERLENPPRLSDLAWQMSDGTVLPPISEQEPGEDAGAHTAESNQGSAAPVSYPRLHSKLSAKDVAIAASRTAGHSTRSIARAVNLKEASVLTIIRRLETEGVIPPEEDETAEQATATG